MITNVSKDRMTVSWKEPADDGKSTILGYMLEKKEAKQMNWTKLNRKPMTERSLEVTGLTEGVEYEFRVIAVNIAGLGKPSEPSASTTAQNPISESQYHYLWKIYTDNQNNNNNNGKKLYLCPN